MSPVCAVAVCYHNTRMYNLIEFTHLLHYTVRNRMSHDALRYTSNYENSK
jgi:hypothetical protein